MRGLGRVDASTYFGAFALLARTPSLALGPLAAALVNLLLGVLLSGGMENGPLGGLQSGIVQIVMQIVYGLGLGLSIAIADYAWRGTRTPFADGLDSTKRRMGDIALAALGFNFIVWAATLIAQSLLGALGLYALLALVAVAIFFFIFTFPAAAIGGIPGGAAMQIALDRAKQNKLSAAIAAALYVFIYYFVGSFALQIFGPYVDQLPIPHVEIAEFALIVIVQALATGYLAAVLAKSYGDASFGRYVRY